MQAMMPLVSQAPRPQMNSASSREAKKGGTVSMWVERVTASELPHCAKTLKRRGSTWMRSTWPSKREASGVRRSKRKLPTRSSLLVMDSISTRARVSSKTFINDLLEEERREKERTRHRAFDPDSAPPAGVASDSGQILA